MSKAFMIVLLVSSFLFSCSEPQTATSCSKVNYRHTNRVKTKTGEEPDKQKFHFSFGDKQQRKVKRSTKRAEKGKKKERDKTKIERRFIFFKKKKQGENDAVAQNKGTFRQNDKKQRKTIKKRSKKPQLGLWPNGKPGR